MTDICDKEIDNFLLTFAEAMAIHAFGDNLVAVRVQQFPAMAYVVLISNLEDEIQFDYLDYFIRASDLFGEKIKLDLIDVLLKYMSENDYF
tara:strand:- start:88 stop:360 length:273 start_codon:yes stop_codon:yes gene_type:complete